MELFGGQPDNSSILGPQPLPDAEVYGSGYGNAPTSLSQQNAELVKWEIELQEVIAGIEHYLRCEEWNAKEKRWIRKKVMTVVDGKETFKDVPTMATDEGIYFLINTIHSFANKGTVLSFYTTTQVNNIMKRLDMAIIRALYSQRVNYKMQLRAFDFTRYSIIVNILSAFNRSIGGKWTDVLISTQKRIEQVVQAQNQNRRRFTFGGFGGGSNNG